VVVLVTRPPLRSEIAERKRDGYGAKVKTRAACEVLAELDEWMAAQPTGLLYTQAVRELMQQSFARWSKNKAP
jgi:hypothetical protein